MRAQTRQSRAPIPGSSTWIEDAKTGRQMRQHLTTAVMMIVTVASAYKLPTVPARRRCPDRASLPMAPHCARAHIQAFAEDGTAMAPSIAALRIQPLTTVLELEHAVVNAQQAGRLLVVKAYAPWCTACKVIEPKYKRAASSNLEVDFCEIDFVQAKALCKHCGVEKLPTGMIFKDGKKVEHSCVRSSEFSGFVSRIAEHADHAEHANAESEALALGARAGRTGRGTGDAARDDLFWESLSG